jgi:hypothetical protein
MAVGTKSRSEVEMVRSGPPVHTRRWNRTARWSGAILAAVAGYFSITYAMAYSLRGTNPELAHRLAPLDGRVTALAAVAKSGTKATANDRREGDILARNALRQDATAVLAASTLGLNAQVRDDVAGAQRSFGYAESLSRRETQTQLWAIEDAVGRGDVTGTLVHYDTALRVKPELSALLYPILLSASTDPAIEAPLVDTLVRKPVWSTHFVSYAAENSKDPKALARIVARLNRRGFPVSEAVHGGVVNALVTGGMIDDAWKYYAALRPGTRRDMSRDPEFAADLKAPTLFDWLVTNAAGTSTTIQRSGRSGLFAFDVSAGTGATLLMQTQILRPGSYLLSGRSNGIDQTERTRPYWTLVCQGGREIGRSVVPNSTEAGGAFRATFTVPGDCPVQTLSLVAPLVEDMSSMSGQIERVQLTPVG